MSNLQTVLNHCAFHFRLPQRHRDDDRISTFSLLEDLLEICDANIPTDHHHRKHRQLRTTRIPRVRIRKRERKRNREKERETERKKERKEERMKEIKKERKKERKRIREKVRKSDRKKDKEKIRL